MRLNDRVNERLVAYLDEGWNKSVTELVGR